MMVPASYAEKAMASLMQLHGELMEEKERRVELHRRLLEREQVVSELKMYVKILEERLGIASAAKKVAARPSDALPSNVDGVAPISSQPPVSPTPIPLVVRTLPIGGTSPGARSEPTARPPSPLTQGFAPMTTANPPRSDGWKVW
jgi:hypothetical protein